MYLLKNLAKSELIRRKITYKRLSEIPFYIENEKIPDRVTLFSIETNV